jgi:conjugative transfer signal peptidase TraF
LTTLPSKRFAIGTVLGITGLLCFGGLCYLAGVRINTSPSIALGLYWSCAKPAEKGDYVMFCPPRSELFDTARKRGYIGAGFCPGGYGYIMKRVFAATNDAVTVTEDGVRVNGKLLPFSAVLEADQGGRPLPRYRNDGYTLNEHQVLLMTDAHPFSFDSRYFGPIDRSQIKSVISPIFTW